MERWVAQSRNLSSPSFLLGVLFLELNGYRFTATEESAAQAILSLAVGTLDEPALAAWLRANAKRA